MPSKPKILIVSREWPPNIYGGAGTHVYSFVKGMLPFFKITILTEKGATNIGTDYPRLPVKVVTLKNNFDRYILSQIEFIVRANWFVAKNHKEYAVIHDHSNSIIFNSIHTVHGTSYLEFMYFKTSKGLLHWMYGKAGLFLLHLWEKLLFKRSQLVMCPSAEMRRALQKHLSVHAIIIPLGVDHNLFRPLNTIKEYDLAYVGRFASVKNISALLEKLNALPFQLRIVFCGLGDDLQAIKGWAGTTHHKVTIKSLPYHQMPLLYNASRFTVLLSSFESFSMVTAESLACGTPVISKMNSPFFVKLQKLYGISEDDPSTTLKIMLNLQPAQYQRISRKCRAFAIANLGLSKNIMEIERVYLSFIRS